MHFVGTFFIGFGIGSLAANLMWVFVTSRRIKRASEARMKIINELQEALNLNGKN